MPADETPPESIPYRRSAQSLLPSEWLLLATLAAVQFTHIVDFMIVMPLEKQYCEGMHITAEQFSYMVSAYGFSAGLAGLIAARFLDRLDRKSVLLGLYAGFTCGTFLCALAPEFVSLLVARGVTGAFGGVAASVVLAIVGDVFPDIRRGTATGVVMSAFSIASVVGLPAGLYLVHLFGYRAPFAILGGLSAVVLICARLLLPPMRDHLGTGHRMHAGELWAVITHPRHVRAYLFNVSMIFSSFLVGPHIATMMQLNLHRSDTEIPLVYLCGGTVTLFTMTACGRLADRVGKLPVFRLLALLTIVPIVAVTNLPPVSLPVILGVTTLFMVLTSGRMVPATAMMTASALPQQRGAFMSVNSSVQQMAIGLSSLVAGWFLKIENNQLIGYSLVGLVGVCGTLVSVILSGFLIPASEEALTTPVDESLVLPPTVLSEMS